MEEERKSTSRRTFMAQAAAGALGIMIVPRHVLGGRGYLPPSDKITLGFIGNGKQSAGLAKRLMETAGIQMVANADVDKEKLERFRNQVDAFYAEKAGKASYNGCDSYWDYKMLLARKDIDAVVVCTPDHWHAIMAIAAMKAGKDVYCEKPLAHTIEEGRAIVAAAKKHGRILQTGSMQRSSKNFLHACELVRNGYIGEVKTVKVNVAGPPKPCTLPEQDTPDTLFWDAWLGPAPMRGYSEVLSPPASFNGWPRWRDYREYGGGGITDWGAHMFDIAQWGLGMDNSGPVALTPPTDPQAMYGLVMKYANGIEMFHEDFGRGWAVQFNGTEGKLEVSRDFMETDPPAIAGKQPGGSDTRLYASENHYQDWIDCIRSRKEPICGPETGHRSASVCSLANIAYELRRPLNWDPVAETFPNDKEANKLLGKKYRGQYKLPKV